MSLQWKFLLWTFVIGFLLCHISIRYISSWAEKENKRIEANRDSMITEQHRLQRELDWETDSITTIFNKQLDTLIYKANKYDSLIRYEKKQRKP